MGAGSNGITFDTLSDPNPVFKVTAFLKNISKTVHFRDKVTKEY